MNVNLNYRFSLFIVSIAFGLFGNACFIDPNPNCNVITHYTQTNGICNDDILHYFTDMPLGKNWLKLDSLPSGKYLHFVDSASNNKTLRVAKGDFNIYLDVYFTEVKKGSTCTECPTQIKLVNRSCFYKIDNELIITIKTNRENTKMPNYNETDWPEYIEISTIDYGNLNHIPGTNAPGFKYNKLIPNLSINGKQYSNVIYVCDSLLMNNANKTLVEAYYTSSLGLLKYKYSDGEIWSLK